MYLVKKMMLKSAGFKKEGDGLQTRWRKYIKIESSIFYLEIWDVDVKETSIRRLCRWCFSIVNSVWKDPDPQDTLFHQTHGRG